MSQQDLDDVFAQQSGGGAGAPSYEFPKVAERNKLVPEVGHVVQGEVVALFKTVVKDAQSGEVKLDKNGNQQPQVNITLKTEFRNWERATKPGKDDDGNELPASEDVGERRIYAKYRMLQAIAKAVKEATGKPGAPREGGILAVRVKGLEWPPSNQSARNPLPDYEARYTPPAPKNEAADSAFAQAAQPEPAAPKQDVPVAADGKPW